MAHGSLLCYDSLCSMLGVVERDFVPSVGVHPEHRLTTDHEHQRSWDVLVCIPIIDSQVTIHVSQCTF